MAMRLGDLIRLVHIARTLSAYDALVPAEVAEQIPGPARAAARVLRLFARAEAREKRPGQRLAAALTRLGPTMIKLGQFLATRADILGPEVARDLADLQDKLPPFPEAEAREAISAALGASSHTLFTSLGPAIAAASIAQVHKATLTEADGTTRTVAVKVLRPGIEARFARELSALALGARLVALFGGAEARRLRPEEVVAMLARSVALETDLRLEAAAASEMAERTAGDPDFRVPRPVWERTAQRVLTTEWIEGLPLRDRESVIAAGRDPAKVAELIIQSFLRHALRDGFFHADMHPGNLFLDAQGRLVAVDFGIMGRLSAEMRRFMAETLFGFLTRDYERIARAHFDVGFVPGSHSVADFAQALRSVGESVFGRTSDQISMARLLAQLFEITRLFDMKAQPQLVLLQKTMVVVEGVARTLDPKLNIWEAARPVVTDWMTAEMGAQARLREMAEGASTLGRALQNLPQGLRNLETIAATVSDGGLRLHPETAEAIAAAESRANRPLRIAVWVGAAALALLVLGQL